MKQENDNTEQGFDQNQTSPENGNGIYYQAPDFGQNNSAGGVRVQEEKKGLRVPLFIAIIAALMACILTAMIVFLSVSSKYERLLRGVQSTGSSGFTDSKLQEIDKIYRENYINDIDENALSDGLIYGYILGANDKYGNYMTYEEYKDYVQSLNSQMVGIGISVTWNPDDNYIEVNEVYENSPAAEAGIIAGDAITEVEGVSVAEIGYDEAINRVRGEKGTKVNLTVVRDGEELQITSRRDEFEIITVRLKTYDDVAVIKISNFYANTPDELKTAFETAQSQGCRKVIFDMRGNSGGLLTSVCKCLDYLLPEGVIVRTLDAKGNWDYQYSTADCVDQTIPMVVLVNENTASAAELFTSSLKDYDKVTVIGTTTYGKGTVTAPFAMSDGSVVYVSIEHYYPPKSDNFEGKGITPDIVLELSEEAQKKGLARITAEEDNQLQKAIEIINQK